MVVAEVLESLLLDAVEELAPLLPEAALLSLLGAAPAPLLCVALLGAAPAPLLCVALLGVVVPAPWVLLP